LFSIAPSTFISKVAPFSHLAHGHTHSSLAGNFKIAVPTISKIVPEMFVAIYESLTDEFMLFPIEELWHNSAQEYERLWNYPGAVAAMDGKHIRIVVIMLNTF